MSSNGGNSSGGGDTEVSGYEAEITKQRRGTKKEINKGVNVSTYGDRKTNTSQTRSDFIDSGKKTKIDTPFTALNLIGNATLDWTNKGSVKTRTFFSNKVLSKKGVTHDGIHYGKTTFENLSLKEQNEIYSGYMEGRMSGRTDAYGNPNPGYNKGGGDGNQTRKTEVQIESESATETKKDDVAISEDEYKKRRGLIGSRSMFSRSGGRGFFDSTGSSII